MTEAQTEVFNQVNDLLREHFYGSLVIVVDENDRGQISTMQYNGGLLQAIGMARAAEAKLIEHQGAAIAFRVADAPEDSDQEEEL